MPRPWTSFRRRSSGPPGERWTGLPGRKDPQRVSFPLMPKPMSSPGTCSFSPWGPTSPGTRGRPGWWRRPAIPSPGTGLIPLKGRREKGSSGGWQAAWTWRRARWRRVVCASAMSSSRRRTFMPRVPSWGPAGGRALQGQRRAGSPWTGGPSALGSPGRPSSPW